MEAMSSGSGAVVPAAATAVTQAMLAEFGELGRLLRRREQLRGLILELLESGLPVQAGPLTAAVTRGQMHRLTASGLRAVIGEENLRVFMDEIPPVPFRRLVVRENGWGAERRAEKSRV